jgi:lactate dehydrogenase-like 2-hydroxyacid dehydrogenase
MKVLFCGLHFQSAYEYTKVDVNRIDPSIEVINCPAEEVEEQIINADLVICFMTKINSALIDRAASLKVIMQFGVGLEGVDIQYARAKGIVVTNIPGRSCGNAQSCAEHAIFLALSLLRNINELHNSLKLGRLGSPIGKTLFKAKILIYGFGSIGKEIFARIVAFDPSEIQIVQRRDNSELNAEDLNFPASKVRCYDHCGFQSAPEASFDADVVFLCCNQTSENIGMVDHNFLSKFQNPFYLINIARVSEKNSFSIIILRDSCRVVC